MSNRIKPLEGHEIVDKIKKALRLSQDTHSWEDIRRGLVEGKYQLFQNDDGVVLTEIVQAPNVKYLNCFIIAGRLPGVLKLQKVVEDHGRQHNCKFMVGTGRLGWRKVMPLHGWTEEAVVFRKDVRYG